MISIFKDQTPYKRRHESVSRPYLKREAAEMPVKACL